MRKAHSPAKVVARGIEPTHTEPRDSTLPSGTSTTKGAGRGERGQLRQEFNDRNFHNPASDTIIPQNSNKSQVSTKNSHNQAQEPKQPRADEILFNGYKEISKEQESNITQTTQQASVDGGIDTNTSPRGPKR